MTAPARRVSAIKPKGKSRRSGILQMISSTLKDVRKGKKEAQKKAAAKKKNQGGNVQDKLNSSASTFGENMTYCTESVCSDDHIDDTSFSTDSSGESLHRLETKAQELLREIQGSLSSYTSKEAELSMSEKYHMDRAKGRFDSGNIKGSVLSMRKVKQLQREYQHVNDAIQFFSFRKLELDRFCQEIKKQTQDHLADSDDCSSLEQQALHICASLGDINTVLDEPDIAIKTPDDELLKELRSIVKPNGADEPTESYFDDEDESTYYSSDDEEDEDETEFSLSKADTELMQDLLALTTASS